jgi:hypothetical protein
VIPHRPSAKKIKALHTPKTAESGPHTRGKQAPDVRKPAIEPEPNREGFDMTKIPLARFKPPDTQAGTVADLSKQIANTYQVANAIYDGGKVPEELFQAPADLRTALVRALADVARLRGADYRPSNSELRHAIAKLTPETVEGARSLWAYLNQVSGRKPDGEMLGGKTLGEWLSALPVGTWPRGPY